jgi:hypothetical protein
VIYKVINNLFLQRFERSKRRKLVKVKRATEILHIFNEVTIQISSENQCLYQKFQYSSIQCIDIIISSEKFPDHYLKPACSNMIAVLPKELTEIVDGYDDMSTTGVEREREREL